MNKKSLLFVIGGLVINIAGIVLSGFEMEYNKKLAYEQGRTDAQNEMKNNVQVDD